MKVKEAIELVNNAPECYNFKELIESCKEL